MQTPDVPHALAIAAWQDKLYIGLNDSAATVTDFSKLPPGHVVELGVRVAIQDKAGKVYSSRWVFSMRS